MAAPRTVRGALAMAVLTVLLMPEPFDPSRNWNAITPAR